MQNFCDRHNNNALHKAREIGKRYCPLPINCSSRVVHVDKILCLQQGSMSQITILIYCSRYCRIEYPDGLHNLIKYFTFFSCIIHITLHDMFNSGFTNVMVKCFLSTCNVSSYRREGRQRVFSQFYPRVVLALNFHDGDDD